MDRAVFAELVVLDSGDDYARVGGRCHQGEVRVGQIFDRMAESHHDRDLSRGIPIALRVAAIKTYGRNVVVLETALTGELELNGSGVKSLHAGAALISNG